MAHIWANRPIPSWRSMAQDCVPIQCILMLSGSSDQPLFVPFSMLVLLREQEIAAQLSAAFKDRYLPEHLFYWLPTSVSAWVALCRSTEYKNADRAIELLSGAVPDLTRRITGPGTLCGLGCGEGSKDRVLLEGFANSGNRLTFFAADFSQSLIELAANHVDDVAVDVLGCKLDLLRDDHLAALTGSAQSFDGQVIYSLLGNSLGAFGPREFPARLREHMRGQDYFLFDGEIFSESTLAGYDNPTNRRFAWGPLTGVGITEDDGRLEFSTAPAGDGLYAVTKHFVATRDLRINVGGEAIQIGAGEKLRMSSSIKYSNESVLLGAVEAARFQIEMNWTSRDGKFVLGCAKPI